MGKKVVTLGEIMLRLSTPGNTRFVQSDSFDVVYGGGEANVAVSCANYGHDAYFVTKLPKHEIGQSAVNALRKYGVKTDFIARGGDRVGIYYLETGASMRPSKVIYDRAHSAIAEADAADFDFDAIMEGADWFHWSGITPAISDKAAELTRLACEAAKRHGVTVSVDLNFRKIRLQIRNLYVARVFLRYPQRLESNDLQRRGILRVKALRHQSYHRPRRWRRLFLRWYHPRPADKTQPGCRPRICSSRFRLEAHYQR